MHMNHYKGQGKNNGKAINNARKQLGDKIAAIDAACNQYGALPGFPPKAIEKARSTILQLQALDAAFAAAAMSGAPTEDHKPHVQQAALILRELSSCAQMLQRYA